MITASSTSVTLPAMVAAVSRSTAVPQAAQNRALTFNPVPQEEQYMAKCGFYHSTPQCPHDSEYGDLLMERTVK